MRILLCGTASDAHTWGLMYLQLVLEEEQYHVHNMGPCVPDAELAVVCRQELPDVLLISSVNGHGHQDVPRAVAALRRDSKLADLIVLAGGMLKTDGTPNRSCAPSLQAAGVDAVFEAHQIEELKRYLAGLAARLAVHKKVA